MGSRRGRLDGSPEHRAHTSSTTWPSAAAAASAPAPPPDRKRRKGGNVTAMAPQFDQGTSFQPDGRVARPLHPATWPRAGPAAIASTTGGKGGAGGSAHRRRRLPRRQLGADLQPCSRARRQRLGRRRRNRRQPRPSAWRRRQLLRRQPLPAAPAPATPPMAGRSYYRNYLTLSSVTVSGSRPSAVRAVGDGEGNVFATIGSGGNAFAAASRLTYHAGSSASS